MRSINLYFTYLLTLYTKSSVYMRVSQLVSVFVTETLRTLAVYAHM